MKKIAVGAGLAGYGLSFPFVSRGENEEVRIGYLPITDAAPLLVAHAGGFFQDEGLAAHRPFKIRTWSALAEAFLAGKCNVTHLLLPVAVWMRYNLGAPVKVLAWNHVSGSAITVRGDSGIVGFADLGGKHIAVPSWYSIHNIILQMGLKKAGLAPVIQPRSRPLAENETNLFILPPQEMPAALSGRKADAYIVAEPYNALGEMKAGAKILRFTGDAWKDHPCCALVMKEDLMQRAPVFTRKVVNALVRAQIWIREHPADTAVLLSRDGDNYLPVAKDVLLRAFLRYDMETYGGLAVHHPRWQGRRIDFQPYPYPSATRLLVNEMKQTRMEGDGAFLGKLDADLVCRDLVDDRFVKKAVEQAGGLEKFGSPRHGASWEREELIDL